MSNLLRYKYNDVQRRILIENNIPANCHGIVVRITNKITKLICFIFANFANSYFIIVCIHSENATICVSKDFSLLDFLKAKKNFASLFRLEWNAEIKEKVELKTLALAGSFFTKMGHQVYQDNKNVKISTKYTLAFGSFTQP